MIKRLLAVCLVLTLCLSAFSGCALIGLSGLLLSLPEIDEPNEPLSEPTEPILPTVPPTTEAVHPGDVPLRYAYLGARDYAPEDEIVSVVSFNDMKYARPDTDALCASFDAITALVEDGADADTILEAFFPVSDAIMEFYTMKNLAYIRYTLDTTDSYYKEENDAMELLSPDIQEKLETFYKACAQSPYRAELERKYFQEGFFDDYEDYSRFTNPEYLALAKEEEQILAEYRTVLEDPQIEYQGKTQSYWELLDELGEIDSYSEYMEYLSIVEAYYRQYNEKVGEIFIRLVKVRKQLAKTMGYESYADYAYEIEYERDYTHEQGQAFCREVREVMVPVFKQLRNTSEYSELDHFAINDDILVVGLQTAAKNMGGKIEEAFRFMQAYSLYDLRSADEKFDSSYTIYLYAYESPFLTINADGTSNDYVTFSHEFGHFVDGYVTYDGAEDLETAETFSQAMEFLSLCYTDGVFTQTQRNSLIRLNLIDLLDSMIYQAGLAEFEDNVYALDDKDLTIDRLNDLYRQCCKNCGFYQSSSDFYYSLSWIDVPHFFEAPYYVISYSVSAGTALQVYLREAEQPGEGLAVFQKLLEREPGEGVQAVMEAAGLKNPFRAGALEELAAFYKEEFNLR